MHSVQCIVDFVMRLLHVYTAPDGTAHIVGNSEGLEYLQGMILEALQANVPPRGRDPLKFAAGMFKQGDGGSVSLYVAKNDTPAQSDTWTALEIPRADEMRPEQQIIRPEELIEAIAGA